MHNHQVCSLSSVKSRVLFHFLGLFDVPSECFMKSVVIVAKKHIQDEELFLNYRYVSKFYFDSVLTFRFNPNNPYPDWYHQPNEEEARRRWSRRSLLFWLFFPGILLWYFILLLVVNDIDTSSRNCASISTVSDIYPVPIGPFRLLLNDKYCQ
jgi:hypothetical protein